MARVGIVDSGADGNADKANGAILPNEFKAESPRLVALRSTCFGKDRWAFGRVLVFVVATEKIK